MATKAVRHYGNSGYTGYNSQYSGSLSDYSQLEQDKNIRSAKRAIKAMVVVIGLAGIIHFTVACDTHSVTNVVESFKRNPVCVVVNQSKPTVFQCK